MKDSTPTTTTLTIPSEFGYERIAVSAASSIAKSIGLAQKRVKDLEVAISEACINAFEHGYEGKADGKVVVRITISDLALMVDVTDSGAGGISLDDASETDPWSRGWGLHLIRKYVDEVTVESEPGKGTRIGMTIYLNGDKTKGESNV